MHHRVESTASESEVFALAGGLEIVAARALGHGEDVRDAVQETLTRALAAVRRRPVPPGAELRAFVYAIARNVITDVVRRRCRDPGEPAILPQLVAAQPSPLEALVRAEEREALWRAVERLPARDRELLRRCFVDGDRLVELARDAGEPVERLRKRKSRALARLRELLREDDRVPIPRPNRF